MNSSTALVQQQRVFECKTSLLSNILTDCSINIINKKKKGNNKEYVNKSY